MLWFVQVRFRSAGGLRLSKWAAERTRKACKAALQGRHKHKDPNMVHGTWRRISCTPEVCKTMAQSNYLQVAKRALVQDVVYDGIWSCRDHINIRILDSASQAPDMGLQQPRLNQTLSRTLGHFKGYRGRVALLRGSNVVPFRL